MQITEDQIKALINEALNVRKSAYAPYSKFLVGAVLIDDRGQKFYGVNVENASYGLTNCAERGAIFAAITGGMKKIDTLVVIGDTEMPISPCGACRQVISEFADKNSIIIMANLKGEYKAVTIENLLPYSFTFST